MGKNQVVHRSTIFSSFIVAKLKSNYVYFVRYIFLAGIATIVDFIVLYSLTEYMHVWYFISSALAYFSGMITNFTLNKIFNFANRSKKIVQQFSIFATVALVGLGIYMKIFTTHCFSGMCHSVMRISLDRDFYIRGLHGRGLQFVVPS